MDERALERRFKKAVEKQGGEALKLTSPGRIGMPDRLVLAPGGRALFVELKAPGKKMRPLQLKRATELKSLGFSVYCIDSTTDIRRFITEVFQ